MKELVTAAEAQSIILSRCQPLPVEVTALDEALGRALGAPVLASRTLPPWDNSAMDGYAVRAADVARAPITLRVVETLYAGSTPQRALQPGDCARIMTGAPLPAGADAVVMQERSRAGARPGEVELLEAAPSGQFVRARGEDAREGEPLLPAGTPLGIPEAALLWGQGITQASVPRRPRVAIASTGDELCGVLDEPRGRIVDTNSPSLAAAVRRAGGLPTQLGLARDDPGDVTRHLERGVGFDVLLTVAGVSVGERDFVRPALEKLGAQMDFWKVAIKPGKPLAFGRLGSTLVFGLPGNPASALVTFELFVRPALHRLVGLTEVLPLPVRALAAEGYKKQAGLEHYVRVVARHEEGQLRAHPLATQNSGAVRSTALASHLMRLPAELIRLEAGEPVELLPVSWTA